MKQREFLLRIYRAESAKDPTSRATEASRSNVIAMQHTVRQMYGEAVVRDVANLITATGECSQSGTNHSLSHICDLIRYNSVD